MKKRNPLSQSAGTMDRRSFLRLSGVLGLGVTSAAILPAAAEAVKFKGKDYKVSETRALMGTYVSMTLFHTSRDKAQEAMGKAFSEIERLNALMNRFDRKTAVAQLNQEGVLNDVPEEVLEVVRQSLNYHRISNGSFDITVKPVIDLYKESFADGRAVPPDSAQLKKALALLGSERIRMRDRTIRFSEPGMGITLDGIAKGYIVDKASDVLARHDIQNHLINAGGDIRTSGSNPEKKAWTVAIEDPEKKRRFPDTIQMNNGAVATSGNYEVYYDHEKMFHHIIDPVTGISPRADASVSVRAKTVMSADALSTSVFVMDPDEGVRFIHHQPDSECLIISRSGKLFKSAGWKGSAT